MFFARSTTFKINCNHKYNYFKCIFTQRNANQTDFIFSELDYNKLCLQIMLQNICMENNSRYTVLACNV